MCARKCVGGQSSVLGRQSSSWGTGSQRSHKKRELFLVPGPGSKSRLLNNIPVLIYMVQILRTIKPRKKQNSIGIAERAWL